MGDFQPITLYIPVVHLSFDLSQPSGISIDAIDMAR